MKRMKRGSRLPLTVEKHVCIGTEDLLQLAAVYSAVRSVHPLGSALPTQFAVGDIMTRMRPSQVLHYCH